MATCSFPRHVLGRFAWPRIVPDTVLSLAALTARAASNLRRIVGHKKQAGSGSIDSLSIKDTYAERSAGERLGQLVGCWWAGEPITGELLACCATWQPWWG